MAKRKRKEKITRTKSAKGSTVTCEVVDPEIKGRKLAKAGKAAKAKKTTKKARKIAKKSVSSAKTPSTKREGMSGLDAAAKLLESSKKAMKASEIAEEVVTRGWWQTNGKTPANTLYAAISTEIKKKGKESRFKREGSMFRLA